MSDQESLSFDPDESTPQDGQGSANRPAVGAKHARPSELGSEDWNQLGQGADFLGLGGDLASGQATPPPSELDVEAPMQVETGAAGYGDNGLSLAEPIEDGDYYQEPYGNEIEFEDGEAASGEFPPQEFGEEEAADGIEFDERFKPKTRKGSPVLATIAVAGLLGAGVVIGVTYLGYSPFQNLPFVEEPAENTAAVNTASTAKTPSSIASTLAGAQGTGENATTDESATDGTEGGGELAQAEMPADPLVEQLGSEEGFQSAAAEPGFETTEATEENFDPVDTILGWFGDEEAPEGGEQVADLESFGPEFTTGEDGEWAASASSAMLDPYEEFTEERRGTADFSEFAPVGSVDPTQTDYTQMDVVWRGEDVPSEMLHSAAKVLTPKVGPVRATTRSGEVFEGRLVAIGKRRVWLAAKAGEYALDGDLISNLERLPDSTTIDDGGTGSPTPTGKRVKAEAAGGVFYGRVLAVQGNKVILITDSGGRITLDSPHLEAVSEGIQIRVKN